MVSPGVYMIKNVKGGTFLDLSGGDRSIIGYHEKGSDRGNQMWRVSVPNDGHNEVTIQSVGTNKYLDIEQPEPVTGIPIIASATPRLWSIMKDEHNENAFRIYYPGTKLYFDLKRGNPADGTPIQLWGGHSGKEQAWLFVSM